MTREVLRAAYYQAHKHNAFPMFTIYKNPRDYPDKYVVRMFLISGEAEPLVTDAVAVADNLDDARAMLPVGLYCDPRQSADEPQIVETWF